MLHLDVPTADQIRRLSEARADACVSIYLRTTPLSQEAGAMRTELANLSRDALAQAAGLNLARGRLAALEEHLHDLADDEEFWNVQANSLAVLATPDRIMAFRLANRLTPQIHVSQRFHLKPLLRAITFPHVALVLALSENGVRLLEVLPEGPPVELRVPALPRDAASAVGKASINDRSPSGRIHGAEGKKVRLTQYARKVDTALRPVLAELHAPLFLASSEPLASIFHGVSTAHDLVPGVIGATADRTPDAELADAARAGLDALYAKEVAAFKELYRSREAQGRATRDIADAGRAAALGAIDTLLIDMDEAVPGTYDETTGAVTLAAAPGPDSYGVVDAIAAQALATGAKVLAVRGRDDLAGAPLAAVTRYPVGAPVG
jgi:hypothetical protein